METKQLTRERLGQLLSYDRETGEFIWERNRQRVKRGTKAGHVCKHHGYRFIKVDNVRHNASRLAWLYVTGEWPNGEIDHINGIRSDNRWVNLRDVPKAFNQRNKGIASNNTSGVPGVNYIKKLDKWMVRIGRPEKYLGVYSDFDEAVRVRRQAEKEMGYDPNHGKRHARVDGEWLKACEHDYQTVHEGWESETLQCSKCGDRYKLYDDEMR